MRMMASVGDGGEFREQDKPITLHDLAVVGLQMLGCVAALAAGLFIVMVGWPAVTSWYGSTEFGCRRSVEGHVRHLRPEADPSVTKCARTGDKMLCFVSSLADGNGQYKIASMEVDCSVSPPLMGHAATAKRVDGAEVETLTDSELEALLATTEK